MKIGIYDFRDPNGKDLTVQQAYETILSANNIEHVRLSLEQPDFWQQIEDLSLFIMRFPHFDTQLQIARDILPVIQKVHQVNCFPTLRSAWHYDDKVKQYHLLRSQGFPMTQSWIFYSVSAALEWAESAEYPVVFKLRGGAGSHNVILVRGKAQARGLIKQMFGRGVLPEKLSHPGLLRYQHFNLYREIHHAGGNLYRRLRGLDPSPHWQLQKNYVLFQEFLPDNTCDTRVTVIGERAFAFRRLVRKDDFRASGSNSIDWDTTKIDPRCLEIAFNISEKMGFDSMAYDFLMNRDGDPEFCEVSYTYVSRAIFNCSGYWDKSLNWHEGNYWPEYLHLVDALGLPDLKAVDLNPLLGQGK